MERKEILKKGTNHDDSEIGNFLLCNCDENYDFKDNWEIIWSVKRLKTPKEKVKSKGYIKAKNGLEKLKRYKP